MDVSNAASDALLAFVAWSGVVVFSKVNAPATRLGSLGMGLVGGAATLGTLRFSGLDTLASTHDFASSLAASLGLPLIGAGYAASRWLPARVEQPLVLMALVVFGTPAVLLGGTALYGTAVGGAAMAVVIAACARRDDQRTAARLGMAGAVLTLVAGLVIGAEGQVWSIDRLDLFHVGLAVANAALALGLVVLAPVPDRSVRAKGPRRTPR